MRVQGTQAASSDRRKPSPQSGAAPKQRPRQWRPAVRFDPVVAVDEGITAETELRHRAAWQSLVVAIVVAGTALLVSLWMREPKMASMLSRGASVCGGLFAVVWMVSPFFGGRGPVPFLLTAVLTTTFGALVAFLGVRFPVGAAVTSTASLVVVAVLRVGIDRMKGAGVRQTFQRATLFAPVVVAACVLYIPALTPWGAPTPMSVGMGALLGLMVLWLDLLGSHAAPYRHRRGAGAAVALTRWTEASRAMWLLTWDAMGWSRDEVGPR